MELLRYKCDEHDFNQQASLSVQMGSGGAETVIELLLSRNYQTEPFGYSALALFFVTNFLLTLSFVGTAAPYGLFVPHFVQGAAFGRIVGIMMQRNFGHTEPTHPGTYALLGAGAFIGGFTRMTIALTVIFVEITSDTSMLLPLMIVLTIARCDIRCHASAQ